MQCFERVAPNRRLFDARVELSGSIAQRPGPVVDPRFSYRAENVVETSGGLCCDRLSDDDPRRSWLGVYFPGARPVGLHEGRHPGLLAAGEADDGQRLHRGLQWSLQGRSA